MKRNNQGQIMKRGGLMAGIGEGAILLIIIQRILSDPRFQIKIARTLFTGKNEYSMVDFANIFMHYIMTRSYSNSVKSNGMKQRYSNSVKPNEINEINETDNKEVIPGFMPEIMGGSMPVVLPDFVTAFSSGKDIVRDENFEKISKLHEKFLQDLLNSVISSCDTNDKYCQLFKVWLYNTVVNFIYFIPKNYRSSAENQLIIYLVVKRDNHMSKMRPEMRTTFTDNTNKFEFRLTSRNGTEPYDIIKTIGTNINLEKWNTQETVQAKTANNKILDALADPPSDELNEYFKNLKGFNRSSFGTCIETSDIYRTMYLKIIGTINRFFTSNFEMSHFSTYLRRFITNYGELIDDTPKFYKLLNSFMIPPVLTEWSSFTRSYPNRKPPTEDELTDMIQADAELTA